MILLQMWMTYEGRLVFGPKIIHKWPNDTIFPFDVNSPQQWKLFLATKFKINNKHLPARDKNGYPYAYRVYHWGGRPHTPSRGGASIINFFPGVSEDGKKRRLVIYGTLLK